MHLINNKDFGHLMLLGAIPVASIAQAQTSLETTLPTLNVVSEIDSSAGQSHQAKAQAPNAITVIGAEQLAQFNEQALGDALRRVAGITFDGANRAREIRLRGLPGEYTQVLINGRPLLDGESRRTVEVDRIPVSLVERVEVVRSPRASQDGQGAAGTINVVLKSGAQQPEQTSVTVGGGYLEDNGALGEVTLGHTGQHGNLSYSLLGSIQQFRRNESKDEFVFDAADAPDEATLGLNERRFDQINLTPSLEWAIGDDNRLRFEPLVLWTKETRDDIDRDLESDFTTLDRLSDERRERIRRTYGAYTAWEHDLSANTQTTLSLNWQDGKVDTDRDETRFDGSGAVDRERQRTELIDLRLIQPAFTLSHDTGSHQVKVGIDGSLRNYEETNGEIRDGNMRPPREDRIFEIEEERLNAYLEDVWQVDSRLILTGGLRAESSSTQTTAFGGSEFENDAFFLLPSLHLQYALANSTDLRAGLSRSLRRPDLRTLSPSVESKDGTVADPDKQGNPELDPEAIWGIDTGIDHYFLDDRGLVSVNVFYRDFSDKIESEVREDNGRFVATPQNVGDARAQGLELDGRLPLDALSLSSLSVWGNAVYTDAEIEVANGGKRRFEEQPDVVANLGIDWNLTSINTTLGVSGHWRDSVSQSVPLSGGGQIESDIDSRWRLDLASRTQLSDGLELSIGIQNLLNQSEERTDRVIDGGGNQSRRTLTEEDTYSSAYARLHWAF